jgi:hypothetical protein
MTTEKILLSTATAVYLCAFFPLFGCNFRIADPTEPEEAITVSTAGSGGSGVFAETIPPGHDAQARPTTGGVGGAPLSPPAPPPDNPPASPVPDPVPPDPGTGVDPGPISCIAPDREEYMEAHRPMCGDPDESYKEHTVLFVFDKSGSMDTGWETGTKWQVCSDSMVESVTTFQHYASAGAIFFPTYECGAHAIDSGFQIDFRNGADYLVQWDASMERYAASGGTPMSQAMQRADQAIAQACLNGILARPFKVVLLTDGEPNCGSDYGLLTELPAKWLEHGIKTHVIGLPGSHHAAALLESIARAGGTETHFNVEEPEELEEQIHIAVE